MLRAVNKRFSARSRSGRRKTLRHGARCRWWSARQRRSVAVSPDYPELGRVQWVVEYRREPATEDMPRKPVAGKARRRIGHWGVRYRPTMMSHLVNADGLLCPGLRIQGGTPLVAEGIPMQQPAYTKSPSERGPTKARASGAVVHGPGGFLPGRWTTAG